MIGAALAWRTGQVFSWAVALAAALVLNGCKAKESKDAPTPTSFDGAQVTDTREILEHGNRLTYVLGCRGCHAPDLRGDKWDDDPRQYGVMWASNLTRAVPRMTDAQLENLLRLGKHPARKNLWVMPSEIFQHLSASDMAALIAHLRSIPATGALSPPPLPGPKARDEIAKGAYKPAETLVRENREVLPADAGSKFALGRYIASLTCAECHGMQLKGATSEEGSTPNLIVASAYSAAEFDHFITTGETLGNRKINELMVQVARSRFSHLTTHERVALYEYLRARAELPQ